jgi:CHAD domain-containing protein
MTSARESGLQKAKSSIRYWRLDVVQRTIVSEPAPPQPSRKLTLAPDCTSAESARLAIRFGLDAMRRQHDAVIAGDVESIHQLRVSSRRLRAAIELFSSVLYSGALKLYRRDIPWIAHQAGEVRNADVMESIFKERALKLDPAFQGALDPIVAAIGAERAAAHKQLIQDLSSRRYQSLVTRLSSPPIKAARATVKFGIAAADLLEPNLRRVAKKGAKLSDEAPATDFHKLRVRIKRLRYILEMMPAMAGKRHRKALARLEELQALLGDYNDVTAGIAWLHNYAASAGAAPTTILAAGAMLHSLSSRSRKLRSRCLKAWARLDKSDILSDLLDDMRTRAAELADAEREALEAAAISATADSPATQIAAAEVPVISPDSPTSEAPGSELPPASAPEEIGDTGAVSSDAETDAQAAAEQSDPANPDDSEHAA